MLWHFTTIATLAKRWGLQPALSIYLRRLSTRGNTSVAEIRIPEIESNVFLRPRSSDWGVLTQVFLNEEYRIPSATHEEALNFYYRGIIEAGETPVIVDCGANSGLASIWYSQMFPRAIVIAVEPQAENYAVLCRNATNRPNIRPIQAAVSNHRGHITLHNPGGGHWSWQTTENADGETETRTIPELFASIPNASPLLVKIDIEGGEVNLFRDNTDWVDRTPLVVFETHDMAAPWQGTAHAVLSTMTKKARDYFQGGENTFAFSHSLIGPQPGKTKILDHAAIH